ncbi:MAG TPA: UDP-N-acetylmuramoyl-L-alanyl-D-glutamate--2,6-diaminopimelate ligase [Spirochaetota bacterium]|nr:UDP-N-acetylmuramoyl-L-alanyl-D-glutamate--2,6-diaminopimelate ligase [Spirochaetota bacterium]HOD15447.1 UDP-N-acetylmuramoyl-L-alanyl-D-glutamate--2,6-diaminopimelate ligase [Spirochaetota bacterium]HPG50728.1 UDP-N-acetylmuramoyl-L-alanyl-D-glutamate--2,6-diaminopimelate ligase [Spirochaetota bacterium]HPN13286.1 UDP-N-acetylmuramoyl-L-alanyl-D-glutamate--2,6-diaminopimelate ligase [Spirochaetota bacterium]HQL82099.1 UDP-N-acetylmuramoyl-L-alanyl-D-glutamate--2,6-diaminopimelate ligase [S
MFNNGISIKTGLEELAASAAGAVEIVRGNGTAVTSVEYDSRAVKKGSLFVAVEGYKSDGHRFVHAAAESGAAAICVAADRVDDFASLGERGIAILAAGDTRTALSRLSAAFFGFPSRAMLAIGVTGTNGKTSITYMLEAVMKRHGLNPGVIGTINYRWGGKTWPAPNTTPESRDLQEILWRMKRDGVTAVIMEVSSHALELRRADDIDFDAAVFTNLTRDHLDFHHDFEHYFEAKKRLFLLLESSFKKGRCGIVNADDEYGRELLLLRNQYSYPVMSFGIDHEADYMPDRASIVNAIDGVSYRMERPDAGVSVDLGLLGMFQLYNSLAALAVAHQMGVSYETITQGLADLVTVPGRFDVLKTDRGFVVIVDYAHTVDALLKLLRSVNELAHRRVITVFGCGGDRDRTKRPLMGKVAEENSDLAIVTSDNPRTEDPDLIIRDIVAGLEGKNHEIIPDREEAIGRAVAMAGEGDIVVIAGKGHEDYQIIGTEKIHFDDKEVAARRLAG